MVQKLCLSVCDLVNRQLMERYHTTEGMLVFLLLELGRD
jgi:hypothetical protein